MEEMSTEELPSSRKKPIPCHLVSGTNYSPSEKHFINLEKDVFDVLLKVMDLFGLVSMPDKAAVRVTTSWRRAVIKSLFIFHLLGGLLGCTQQFLTTFLGIIFPQPNEMSNAIVRIITYMPYLSEYSRAVIVLAFFLHTRPLLLPLMAHLSRLMNIIPLQYELAKRWRSWTICLSIFTVIIHLTWESIGWINYSDGKKTAAAEVEVAVVVADSAPFRVPNALWLSSVYFECLLFILSQQIIIISIVLAWILVFAVQDVNQRILTLRAILMTSSPSTDHVTAQFTLIELMYLGILRGIKLFNEMFSSINAFWYWLDLMTCLGFLAGPIAGARHALASYISMYGSIIIFGLYVTVAFLPLVALYHQAQRIEMNFYCLSVAVWRAQYKANHDPRLRIPHHTLRSVQLTCEEAVIALEGAGLLVFNRNFLIQTMTLAVSFGVIAYEIVLKATV